MKKLQSLRRRNVVLGVLTVGLLALVVLRPAETSSVKKERLPHLLEKFHEQVAGAATVQLERVPVSKEGAPKEVPDPAKAKTLTLDRSKTGKWAVTTAFGHPVKEGAVDRLLDQVGNARRQQQVTQRADTFDKYADSEGWIRIVVKDAAGKALADLQVGKFGNYPEVYVLVDDGGTKRVFRVVDFDKHVVSLDTEDWIETNVWQKLSQDAIGKIEVEQRRDQRTIAFEKAPAASATPKPPDAPKEGEPPPPPATPDDAGPKIWRMTSPMTGEARKDDVDDLVRSFAGLRLTDVAAAGSSEESDKVLGFDDPELVITATAAKPEKEGAAPVTYVLVVGKKTADDKSWNVRRKGESFAYTVSSYAIDPFRKAPESFLPAPATTDGEKKDDAPKDEEKKDEKKPDGAPATGDPDK